MSVKIFDQSYCDKEDSITLADKLFSRYPNFDSYPPVSGISIFMSATMRTTTKYFDCYYENHEPFVNFCISRFGEGIFLTGTDKLRLMADEVFRKYWTNQNIKQLVDLEYKDKINVVDGLYNKLTGDFVANNSIDDLLSKIAQAVDAAWLADARSFFTMYFDKDLCLQLISQLNIGISREHLDKIWDIAVSPVDISFDKRHLLFYLSLVKDGVNEDKIAESCQYFYGNLYDVPSLGSINDKLIDDYGRYDDRPDLIQDIIAKESSAHENRLSNFNNWFNDLSEEEKKLVNYIQWIIRFRDVRKDLYGKILTIRYRVAERMFANAGLDRKYIIYYTHHEMMQGFDYLVKNKELIKKRESGFCAFFDYQGNFEFEYGHFEENKKKMHDFYLAKHPDRSKIEELKGQIGSPGKVTGKVRVVLQPDSADKIEEGSILVAGMTRPEFVPLMKKAAAFITNEGGITCHAAIVAREMKKPCVIGTKIATHVLKDGDLVEVDADKGIVRILNKIK